MDYLTLNRIHLMIWSPLAGGRLFRAEDALCDKAIDKINEIAKRHGEEPETIIYAWLIYHPVRAVPISGRIKQRGLTWR